MNNLSSIFRRCSPWHLCFLTLLLLVLLFCVHQRLLLKTEAEDADELRLRRGLAPSKLELFGNLFPMKDYLSSEQLLKLQFTFDQYNVLRKIGNQTIGMEYVDFFLPGEINLTKLDRDSLKRLQMLEIVDEMVKSGGNSVKQQIEEVIRRYGQLREARTQSETRHELQTDAWDVCLGEQHTLCNGHLSVLDGLWHCVCALTPLRHSPRSSRLCSSSFRIRNVPSKVLTVPLLFPLPELFGFQSSLPQLMDLFLAHWLTTTFRRQIKWNQVLLLRKQCVDEHFFVVQFAFLKKPAPEWIDGRFGKNVKVQDDDLLDIANEQIRAGRRALWTDQTVLERAFVEEVSDLLPEEMSKTDFFRKKVAKLYDESQCSPPWDYKSFVLCHLRELLFVIVASVFGFAHERRRHRGS
uniref:Uncharacterized protein n=1 Tax=Globodera rostochiensis TaxID=31243 RepID=A0A914HR69_GLORO